MSWLRQQKTYAVYTHRRGLLSVALSTPIYRAPAVDTPESQRTMLPASHPFRHANTHIMLLPSFSVADELPPSLILALRQWTAGSVGVRGCSRFDFPLDAACPRRQSPTDWTTSD